MEIVMMKNPLTRRTFLGATSAIAGTQLINAGASGETGAAMPAFSGASGLVDAVNTLVDETPFIDTHEHFWEESERISSLTDKRKEIPAPDFGMLLCHYTDSDLQVAGMPAEEYEQLRLWNVPPAKKWELVAPWYAKCRHTGYQMCIRESLRLLFDETDLRVDNYENISKQIVDNTVPGFYARILHDVANIEYAHVNCIQRPLFRDTETPDLFGVDLSINSLCVPPKIRILEEMLGDKVKTLAEAKAAIDTCFKKYGNKAVAIKSQCAYWRSLNFINASAKEAEPVFKKYAAEDPLSPEEHEVMQGHLFHYCMKKAEEYDLVVKLHTGYYAGHGGMPLSRVRDNVSDLCPVFKEHPNTKFSLFHIAYPYQEEIIAVAKQYANVYADMCWAWIINPAASVRFLKEFIMAAPACKLFTFGGDYLPVEMTVGHAAIARRGIAQAITELVQEGWLLEEDVPDLVTRIMCGNAREFFNHNQQA